MILMLVLFYKYFAIILENVAVISSKWRKFTVLCGYPLNARSCLKSWTRNQQQKQAYVYEEENCFNILPKMPSFKEMEDMQKMGKCDS